MRAIKPSVDVPGDNTLTNHNRPWLRERIMDRCGELMGMNRDLAVWRFGFSPESEAAQAYGVCIPKMGKEWPGFLWVLATRRTGKVKEKWLGYAIELPSNFRAVIDFDVR